MEVLEKKSLLTTFWVTVMLLIAECIALREGVAAKNNGFLDLEIEGDSKVIIDCHNKKCNLRSSIILLMEDIWNLFQNLNIHKCSHIYREANRTADWFAKKGIVILILLFGGQTFLEML